MDDRIELVSPNQTIMSDDEEISAETRSALNTSNINTVSESTIDLSQGNTKTNTNLNLNFIRDDNSISYENSINILMEALSQQNMEEFLNNDLNLSGIDVSTSSPFIKLTEQYEHISENLKKVIVDNKKLNDEALELKKEIWDLWDKIYYIEKDLAQHQQYSRRQNIEISGIPDYVTDDQLETTVIRILRRIGIDFLESYEIVGCHHLKRINREQPANVIIRFVNRKRAYACLQNRRNLKWDKEFKNIFIVENLCPKYKSIFDACSDLKKTGKIKHVWSYNGTVHYKTTDSRNDRGKKIFHISELEEQFPSG